MSNTILKHFTFRYVVTLKKKCQFIIYVLIFLINWSIIITPKIFYFLHLVITKTKFTTLKYNVY